MIFKPTCKQGIKRQKCRICTVENLYFVKQALPRLSWYVTHLSRFSNTFRIYNSMQCWILYKDFESKGQKCPVLQDERWVHDWNFPSACTWVYWKGSHDVTQKAVTYLALVSQNRALLTFRLKVFVQNSTLHGFVYTKAVKEWEEISCFLFQSWKRSFRKIQIFRFAYCAGRCFITCLGWNHLCSEWYIRKALKYRKRLVASRYSLRSARFAKFAYSALPLFYSLFRLSHRGIGLLRHWIFSFQYMIIHFNSFRFEKRDPRKFPASSAVPVDSRPTFSSPLVPRALAPFE